MLLIIVLQIFLFYIHNLYIFSFIFIIFFLIYFVCIYSLKINLREKISKFIALKFVQILIFLKNEKKHESNFTINFEKNKNLNIIYDTFNESLFILYQNNVKIPLKKDSKFYNIFMNEIQNTKKKNLIFLVLYFLMVIPQLKILTFKEVIDVIKYFISLNIKNYKLFFKKSMLFANFIFFISFFIITFKIIISYILFHNLLNFEFINYFYTDILHLSVSTFSINFLVKFIHIFLKVFIISCNFLLLFNLFVYFLLIFYWFIINDKKLLTKNYLNFITEKLFPNNFLSLEQTNERIFVQNLIEKRRDAINLYYFKSITNFSKNKSLSIFLSLYDINKFLKLTSKKNTKFKMNYTLLLEDTNKYLFSFEPLSFITGETYIKYLNFMKNHDLVVSSFLISSIINFKHLIFSPFLFIISIITSVFFSFLNLFLRYGSLF